MKRNRIIYFIFLIAAIVLASFYGGPITYSLLFGLIMVAPVSLAYLIIVYFFFKLYQVIGTKRISAYEPVRYYFVLQNEYFLNFCHISVDTYSTFSYIEELDKAVYDPGKKNDTQKSEKAVVYELLPGESTRYDTTLICRYRGDYNVGIKDITIIDFFGLFKITYKVPEPLSVTVIPRIINVESIRSVPEMTVSSYMENMALSSDFDTLVREYLPGDPLKGIHWKATAKTGKLQSRLRVGEQKQGISIFLDTKRISDDEYIYIPLESKCLEIALALTNYFASFSVTTTLYYSQSTMKQLACGSTPELESFLSDISLTRFRSDEDASIALDELLAGREFSDCLIAFLIITGADVELNKRLYELSLIGIKIVVYYVGYKPDKNEIMELQNLNVIIVNPEDDLTKVL